MIGQKNEKHKLKGSSQKYYQLIGVREQRFTIYLENPKLIDGLFIGYLKLNNTQFEQIK